MKNNKILSVEKLNKYFVKSGKLVKVLDNINFDVYEEDFFGIIGESGSGKSTIGKCLIRLYSSSSGNVSFCDKVINQDKLSRKNKKWLCQNMSMIFQDPMSSLNPKKNVLSLISEPLVINKTITNEASKIIEQCKHINQYFQNTYKWQDYNLTNKYYVPFLKFAISSFKQYIEELNLLTIDKKIFEKMTGNVVDLEQSYKSGLKNVINFVRLIKLLLTYNIEKLQSNDLDQTEINYHESEENLKNQEKYLKLPKEYYDLEEILDLKNKMLDSYLLGIKFKYKEQNANRFKSIISSCTSEMKSLKQNKTLTHSITEHVFESARILILEDTLACLKKLKDDLYIETSEIEKYAEYISERISSKYTPLLNDIKKLEKLSEKLDQSNLENTSREEISNTLSLYNKLEKEISENLIHSKKRDFLTSDKDLLNRLNALLNISQKKENEIKNEIHSQELEINEIKAKMKLIKQNFNAIKDNNKNDLLEKAKGEFEKARYEREKFANNDNKFFEENKIPLIEEQINLVKQLNTELSLEQDKYKKAISSKIKEIKKVFEEDTKLKNKIKILEKEMKLKFLTIEAINFELETYQSDVELFRKLRTKNKILLKLYKPFLKNILIRDRVYKALDEVGLKNEHAYRYPHEFSGGQRQRIVIARALISKPKLVIADEPISALDVSIQAQVINIMKDLAKKLKITFIFIAHDLSVVRYTSNRLIIMHKGVIVEKGDTNEIFRNPIHPYTKSLIKASPELGKIHVDLASFSGDMNYDSNYTTNNKPEFYSVSNSFEHFVFATEGQIKKWVK